MKKLFGECFEHGWGKYKLRGQDEVWLDSDAFCFCVNCSQQAKSDEERVRFLEEAVGYALRGPFLKHQEVWSWLGPVRVCIADGWVYCVKELSRCYERAGKLKEKEDFLRAARVSYPDQMLLQEYLIRHLWEHGRAAEAIDVHTQFVQSLQANAEYDIHKKDMLDRLLASLEEKKQSREEVVILEGRSSFSFLGAASSFSYVGHSENPHDFFLELESHVNTLMLFHMPPLFIGSSDVLSLVKETQIILHREMSMVYQDFPENMSEPRRQFFKKVGKLLAASMMLANIYDVSDRQYRERLPLVSGLVASCWHTLNEGNFAQTHETARQVLPFLQNMVCSTSGTLQQSGAFLLAQVCLLQGLLVYHQGRLQERVGYCHNAVEYAKLSGDTRLEAACYIHLANALCFGIPVSPGREAFLPKALALFQRAVELSQNGGTHFLRAKSLAEYGSALAAAGNEYEANRHRDQAFEIYFGGEISQEPPYLASDFGPGPLTLQTMITWDQLAEHGKKSYYKQVEESYDEFLRLRVQVPERFALEMHNYLTDAVLARGELDRGVYMLTQGYHGAQHLKSTKRLLEVQRIHTRAQEQFPLLKQKTDFVTLGQELALVQVK
ncbi:hypothetical protein EI42_04383 [Thermosporothrix hazakensis]|uniref:Uncharacterized protein n=3 Tax=Thermosporothrix hazakensis TaxID=644383 RepID=A0A326UB94_THEHA|nr:hypothetical protein EI42_04383 [Thermosporothrix hazakensis]GCE50562.1 hypothetical protein KTH_54310 [Thermosporothrix hazakensis]